MIAIDRPNTYVVSPGFERRRLSLPFRYKQDEAGIEEFLNIEVRSYKENLSMTFELRFRNYPVMI